MPLFGLSIDTIWRRWLESRRIDFLKIDIDSPWPSFLPGMEELLNAHAFSVATVEIDLQAAPGDEFAIDHFNDVLWSHGYGMFLKYNCDPPHADVQRTSFYPIHGRYRRSIQDLNRFWGSAKPVFGARLVQDVIIFDMSLRALPQLLQAGNVACGTDFPTDTRCGLGNVLHAAPGVFLPFS